MLPSTPGSQNITEFNVALSSVTAVSSTGRDSLGSSSFPATVLLDSGGTISTLPDDLVDEIWHEAGAIQDEVGTPHVPCSFANNDAWFEFGFGGPGGAVIKVSLSQLVSGGPIRIAFTNGTYKGQEACGFGIRKGGGRSVLGDTFLRSAYVVYDLENLEIGLADAIFNKTSSGSSVVPFARKAAPIPSSTPAPSQDSAAMRAAAVTATPTVYAAANGFQSNTTTKSAALSGPRGNWKFTISLVVGLVLILSL
jgi:elongation factor G